MPVAATTTARRLDLDLIVRRAAFLRERWACDGLDEHSPHEPDPSARRRLARWTAIYGVVRAYGPGEAVARRWQWDGLEPDALADALSDAWHPRGAVATPPWARTLQAIVDSMARPPIALRAAATSEAAIPFEDLYAPIVAFAVDRLRARTPAAEPGLVSELAQAMLERDLMIRLAACAESVLAQEFERHRRGGTAASVQAPQHPERAGRQAYDAFTSHVLETAWTELFHAWPVMARLMATTVDLWVDATSEMLHRLSTDLPALRALFDLPPSALRRLQTIEPSVSDAHHGHRSAAILHFDDGMRLLYKTKDLALDVAFNELLHWCNRHGAPQQQRVLRVLPRAGYGWCEFATHSHCEDPEAVARFHERAGALLCVTHMLRGTDAHHGNIIAQGEWPLLIDTETLLHPEPVPMVAGTRAIDDARSDRLYESVFRTGMLPHWTFGAAGEPALDISGLASAPAQDGERRRARWLDVNTDAMRLAQVPAEPRARRTNLPTSATRSGVDPQHARLRMQYVRSGFERMYDFLRQRTEALLADGGPLAAMRRVPVRYIFRATRIYQAAMNRALAPDALRNGADYSIELERLGCAFLMVHDRPAAWPILAEELRAIEELDYPFLLARADSRSLPLSTGTTIERYFGIACFDEVCQRLRRWNEDDRRFQAAVIEGCFEASQAHGEDLTLLPDESPFDSTVPAPATSLLVQQAQAIAQDLIARSFRGATGLDWLLMKYVHDANRFQLRASGDDLYDGRLGIALFLAALDSRHPDERLRRATQASLLPLLARLEPCSTAELSTLLRLEGLGCAVGAAGLVYGLTRIAGFTGQSRCLDIALRLARALDSDLIAKDRSLDVIGGAAGLVLALLVLHETTGEPACLNHAVAAGEHLLRQRAASQHGHRAWKGSDGKIGTGFAHGAAGIALALGRLAAASGESRFRDAAREAIAFERAAQHQLRTHASSAHDPTVDKDPGLLLQWCHGAPGIALARIGQMRVDAANVDRREIEDALLATAKSGIARRDHMCCGNASRIEALWEAGHALDDATWRDEALARATAVIDRAKNAGAYQLTAHVGAPVYNPGLFQGTAGIGYQWLRMAHPDLPSVLLWQ